jgi:hypothetical protein
MAKMAKLAVLVDRNAVRRLGKYGMNAFGAYAREVLAHAGMSAVEVHDADELAASGCDVAIAAVCEEDDRTVEALKAFLDRGGIVFACANLNKLGTALGYAKDETVAVGYAHGVVPSGEEPAALRFLEAVPWRKVRDDALAAIEERGTIVRDRPDGPAAGVALQRFGIGAGMLYRWSVDIWNTIVRMQQGTGPVFDDGVPAPDGTGAVDEGILKADDRIAMDWECDRRTTETGMPYFAFAYADLWREAFLSVLLEAIVRSGKTLPFVGYYPDGVSHVLMISHDSDLNRNEHARATLDLLKELGINTTWCMLEPGYDKAIYDEAKAAGHEIAFHYNALDAQGGHWSEQEFARQLGWLKQAAGVDVVTSNKNHYTRFEGWGELFEWCEKYGIAADQTRGPSKKGNVGLLFGTCHPYFPIAWANDGNRMYDVLEMSFLTQDLELGTLSDNTVIRPFLEQVKRVEGVAHFLYHQTHIHRLESVRDSIRKLVSEARQLGFDLWTGKKVNDWERYRRTLKAELADDGSVQLSGPSSDWDIVVYVPVAPDGASDLSSGTVRRFGVPCRKLTLKIATVKSS